MADAQFSYANVDLLFDHNQQAQRFLDRFLPLEQLVTPAENPGRDDWQSNTYGQGRAGLPRPNYPPPPPPRINTLYWPTGAVRWARGWFLGDQAAVEQLTGSGSDSAWPDGHAVARTLRCSTPGATEPDPYVLEAEMFLLRPLRLTATADEVFGDLWLLPLVDQRYWWQFRQAGDLTASLTDWETLVGALGTALGLTIECETVDAAYMIPDRIELARHHDNLAVVLDAVAHSIGRRVVVGYDGTVRLVDYATEQTLLTTNRTNVAAQRHLGLQGGTPDDATPPAAYPWPEKLLIAFEKIEDPANGGARTYWTSEQTAETAAATISPEDLVTVEGAVKCLHSSAWAMFQAVDPPTAEPTDPANKTNLDTLVEQYSLDYYGWLLHQYDHAWPGIQHWDPTGYCDHVLFELGTEYLESIQAIADLDDQQLQTNDILIQEQLARRYMTRVQSMPGNFGVSSLLCQYEHAIPGVADGLVVMTPESGIAARSGTALSKAACAVWTEVQGSMTLTAVSCDDSGTPWKINVYNVVDTAVGGSLYVVTDLLKSGTRYVLVEPC